MGLIRCKCLPTHLELAEANLSESENNCTPDGKTLVPVLLDGPFLPQRTLFWRSGREWAVRQGSWKLVGDQTGQAMLFNLEEDIVEERNPAEEKPDLVGKLPASCRDWEKNVPARDGVTEADMNRDKVTRISVAATKSCHDKSVVIDTDLIRAKAEDARQNDRKREMHVFHTADEDQLQRMLNALQPGSYITPHRHHNPPKSESIVLLRGVLGYASFGDDGTVQEGDFILLDAKQDMCGLDSRPGVWHTIFALDSDTVIFEVKPGPYDSPADKGFAPWAPDEGSPEAVKYLMELEDRFRSIWKLPSRSWRGAV